MIRANTFPAAVFLGLATVGVSAAGTVAAATFDGPEAVAVDARGNVYVADMGNSAIRKITPAGLVTTLAGRPGVEGYTNGTGAAALFGNQLGGIAVDARSNVYIADSDNDAIRKITPAGVVTTLAGTGERGHADGAGTPQRR